MKLELLDTGICVGHLYWELLEKEHLWNAHKSRTTGDTSPHRELDDIWVRFGTPADAESGAPHVSEWYPGWEKSDLRGYCEDLVSLVNGVELGGVLITRIPPRKQCYPHTDTSWHAKRYDKYALQITSAPGQEFWVEDHMLVTRPGDLYRFDNSLLHWVFNPTKYERVTMIVCIRGE